MIELEVHETCVFCSETISQLGRKLGLYFLLVSIVFLLLGYGLGGSLLEVNRRTNDSFVYIRTEYIYSIVYGALFYTALVTLVSVVLDEGFHLGRKSFRYRS